MATHDSLSLYDREEFIRNFFGSDASRDCSDEEMSDTNIDNNRLPGDLVTCGCCQQEYILTAEAFDPPEDRLARAVHEQLECPTCVGNLFALFTNNGRAA